MSLIAFRAIWVKVMGNSVKAGDDGIGTDTTAHTMEIGEWQFLFFFFKEIYIKDIHPN